MWLDDEGMYYKICIAGKDKKKERTEMKCSKCGATKLKVIKETTFCCMSCGRVIRPSQPSGIESLRSRLKDAEDALREISDRADFQSGDFERASAFTAKAYFAKYPDAEKE
jgi:ribosomal protein L37AE/L43A